MFPSSISFKTTHTYQNNPEMPENSDVPLYFQTLFQFSWQKDIFYSFLVFFSWKNQDILYWIWMNFERILSAFLNNESFLDRGMTKEMPNFSLNITTGSWEWEMRLSNYRQNYGIQSIYLLILLLSNQKFFDLEQLFS